VAAMSNMTREYMKTASYPAGISGIDVGAIPTSILSSSVFVYVCSIAAYFGKVYGAVFCFSVGLLFVNRVYV